MSDYRPEDPRAYPVIQRLERETQQQKGRIAALEAELKQAWGQLAECNEFVYEPIKWTQRNQQLTSALKLAKEALARYVKSSNWTEYAGSLKPHWYWTDGTTGTIIATEALAEIQRLLPE